MSEPYITLEGIERLGPALIADICSQMGNLLPQCSPGHILSRSNSIDNHEAMVSDILALLAPWQRDHVQDVLVRFRSTHAFNDFVGSVGSMSETHGMPSFFISTAS